MTTQTPKAQSSVIASEPGLRLRGVSKSFGSVVALQPTSFDVPAGTLCALLGPVRMREDDDPAHRRRFRSAG